MKKVMIRGITGRMGRETARTVLKMEGFQLASGLSRSKRKESLAEILQDSEAPELEIGVDLESEIEFRKPDIMIDFTGPEGLLPALEKALKYKIDLIIGTTGLNREEKSRLEELSQETGRNVFLIPNFALGAVLLMKFAREASRFFSRAEIIESHSEEKADAPSGTSLATAEGMEEIRPNPGEDEIRFSLPGVRGGSKEGVNIHSLRLPGIVARQEVVFGGEGQTLTLTHNSLSRKSFMPGVKLALKKIKGKRGFVYGLEELME